MLNVDEEPSLSLSLATAYRRVDVVFHDDDDDDDDAYLLVATSHVRKSVVVKASAVAMNSTNKTARSGVKLIIIMGQSAFLS